MSGRRAAVALLVMMVLLPPIPLANAAETFGALAVSGPAWNFPEMGPGSNFSAQLFQVIGDANGDGYDDLIAWSHVNGTQNISGHAPINFTTPVPLLFLGGPSGFPPAAPSFGSDCGNADPRFCRQVFDAGAMPGLDSRPVGVDVDADGFDDALALEKPTIAVCIAIWPTDCGIPQPTLHFGGNPPLTANGTVQAWTQMSDAPPESVYVLPPTSSSETGGALVEVVRGRGANGTSPAVTAFVLVSLQGRAQVNGGVWPSTPSKRVSWTAEEPSPLAASPRPPRFVGAPDFDGDGLADIVTWSPPALGANGVYPGVLTIYNGSSNGPNIERPFQIQLQSPEVLLADFDADGHDDVASYRLEGAPPGQASAPHIGVEFRFWHPDGFRGGAEDAIHLSGPSIFLTQPPVRLRAGDIDGDGAADLATLKYDTTSASAGHLLVDVFMGGLICKLCDRDIRFVPEYSTEIQLSGPDIYANADGLRLNLQGDFDGDGLRDITVGYFGGNAPERGRTSTSGFVAVLYAATVVQRAYKIWLDTEPGLIVVPGVRSYTIHIEGWLTILSNPTLRVDFTGLPRSLSVDIDHANGTAVSSSATDLSVAGSASASSVDTPAGGIWTVAVSVRFHWPFPANQTFGLAANFEPGYPGDRIFNPVVARFMPGVLIAGSPLVESEGRTIASNGWVRGGAIANFSNLTAVFESARSVPVPSVEYIWLIVGQRTFEGGNFAHSATAPGETRRDWYSDIGITGPPTAYLPPLYHFPVNVDGNVPQFGDHLPLESEWVTSSPAMVAVEIFDNESGVDPSRIEVSWENDGAPFVRWDRATALPGETAAQVVGRAFINFPEGNLSNLIWRVCDNVGNGPVESPIFGIKVDTQGITFHDSWPAPEAWQNGAAVAAGVWVRTGPSGPNNYSVEYRISTSGVFGFGAWQPPCQLIPANCAWEFQRNPDGSFEYRYRVNVELSDGDDNWIQWRARNNAGADSNVSEPFQIRVDSRSLVISLVSPNATTLFPLGPVSLVVTAHEGSPEDVAQRGIDTAPGHSTFRIRGPGQLGFGAAHPFPQIIAGPNGWSAEFRASLALERGNSTVEVSVREVDGRTTTAETTIRINQLPSTTVVSDPANFTVLINGTILLTATGTDPDGQELRFSWGPCPQPTPREPPRQPEVSRNASVTLSTTSPEPLRTTSIRTISLCVTAFDGLDGVFRLPVNVSVVETLPAPPPAPTAPPPPSVSVLSPEADAFFLLVLLLAAAGAAAALVVLRRRRLPPDNL